MMRMTTADDPLTILLIEDTRGDAILIERAIDSAMPAGYTLERAVNLSDALQKLAQQRFDVALLDRSLPDVEGFEGLHSLQNMAPELPVIFLTAYKDEHIALEAIEAGAQDYLFKDMVDGQVIRRAMHYAILRKQFESVLITRANYDMLTGLANRMLFESRLEMALARMRRQPGALGLLFLDLDRFKQVNDTHGHAAGDELLKAVASRLEGCLRPYDTAARFGGDEFAVLLENIPKLSHTQAVAEKIIPLFEQPFLLWNKLAVDVGVSIGVVACSEASSAAGTLMKQADEAMYRAKSQQGSCYVSATQRARELARTA